MLLEGKNSEDVGSRGQASEDDHVSGRNHVFESGHSEGGASKGNPAFDGDHDYESGTSEGKASEGDPIFEDGISEGLTKVELLVVVKLLKKV